MFTHKTREKMCAEIFDVFVFCSLSGRTRASWVVSEKEYSSGIISSCYLAESWLEELEGLSSRYQLYHFASNHEANVSDQLLSGYLSRAIKILNLNI
jgi:hypothetical protein